MHLSTARKILNRGDVVSLTAVKADGSLLYIPKARSMRYDFRGGWRNIKVLSSGQVRKVRDVCIIKLNSDQVYL